MDVQSTLDVRWADAYRALHPRLVDVRMTWCIGESTHFNTNRGFATMKTDGTSFFHLTFAEKIRAASMARLEGILRHELGHVIDFAVEKADLDAWARIRGLVLPDTRERRADAIALAIWGAPIRYDSEQVQNIETGIHPRPAELGP